MNLYVLRHASAGTRRTNEALDAKRPLDKEGKQQCILVANCLNALNVHFDVIASSPLKRAMQTASLVGMEMGYEAKLHITEALNFTGKVPDFHKLVTELSVHENVLVVGHNPNLEQFLASLIAVAPSNAGGKTDLAAYPPAQKRARPSRLHPASWNAALAARPTNAEGALLQRHQELAAKDLEEIVRLFAKRP